MTALPRRSPNRLAVLLTAALAWSAVGQSAQAETAYDTQRRQALAKKAAGSAGADRGRGDPDEGESKKQRAKRLEKERKEREAAAAAGAKGKGAGKGTPRPGSVTE